MNSAITTIEELGIRKDAALANQEKLNEYFELALTGHINITRDSITSLLEEFGFNEEEQRETAKILMFPEDALFAYDEKIKAKEKTGKSIGEVIQEAKEMIDDENKETTTEETQQVVIEEPIPEIDLSKEITDPTDELINTLKDNGIDYLDFSSDEVNKLMNNFEKDLIVENISYIKSKNLQSDIFVNHISLMYDRELKNKIELLLSVGKDILDIYVNPNVLVKYTYDEMENAINAIKGNGMDPKEIPLMAY